MKFIVSGLSFSALVILGSLASAQLAPPANYGQSHHWMERAAESGDVEAQYLFARRLENGVDIEIDIQSAA